MWTSVSIREAVGREFADNANTDLSFLPFVYRFPHKTGGFSSVQFPVIQKMQTFTIICSLILKCPFRAKKLPTVAQSTESTCSSQCRSSTKPLFSSVVVSFLPVWMCRLYQLSLDLPQHSCLSLAEADMATTICTCPSANTVSTKSQPVTYLYL